MATKRFCDACDEELDGLIRSLVLTYTFPNRKVARIDISYSVNNQGQQQIIGNGELCPDCRKEALENGSPL